MPKIDESVKSKRADLILSTAAEMFEEYGFEEMKISALAKEVGLSVGTIYAYFDSKEGLYEAWVAREIEGAYLLLKDLFSKDLVFEELLEQSIQIKFEVMFAKKTSLQSGALNNPFFFESQQVSHKVAFEKLFSLYVEPIEKIKTTNVDTMQLIYILNAMSNAYVIRFLEGEFDSFDGKAKELSILFLSLLGAKI